MASSKPGEVDLPVGKIIGWGLFAVFALIGIFGSLFTVDAGQEAVVLTWGKVNPVAVEPGIHVKWPIAQSVVRYDVKTAKYETSAAAASKDLQDVSTTITVNYHIAQGSVPTIHNEIGADYGTKLIQPMVQDSVKAATAQFTAEELITKRPVVREKIVEGLRARLDSRGIIVEDISITNFAFSAQFTAAIEAKVTADQNAQTELNRLKTVEYQAQQKVAQAQGERDAAIAIAEGQANATLLVATAEAEKIRLQNQELAKSPQYVELIKWQRWDGHLPPFMMGGGSSTPIINIPAALVANVTGQQ